MTAVASPSAASSSIASHPLVAGTIRQGKRIRQPVRVTLGSITPNNIGTVRKLNTALFPVVYSDKFYKEALEGSEELSKLVFYQDLPVGNLISRLEPSSTEPATTLSTSIVSQTPPPAPAAETAASASSAAKGKSVAVEKQDKGPHKLYIMTLGVLPAYRSQGLATLLLTSVLSTAASTHLPTPPVSTPAPAAPKKAKTDVSAEARKEREEKEKKEKEAKEEEERKKLPVVEGVYLHVQVGNEEAKRFYEKFGFEVTNTVKNYFRKIEPRDAWVLEKKITAPTSTPAETKA